MRKQIFTAIIILITLSLPSLTMASSDDDYGLYWGVSEGQRIDFHAKLCMPLFLSEWWALTGEYDEDVYVIIDTLPDDFEYLSSAGFTVYWTNGSIIDQDFPSLAVFPLGNWSFIEERTDPYDRYNFTQSFSTWQVSRSASVNSGLLTYEFFAEFSKSDGVLNHWYLQFVDTHGDEVGLVNVVRLGVSLELTIAVVAGSIGGIAILILFWHRRKSKHIMYTWNPN